MTSSTCSSRSATTPISFPGSSSSSTRTRTTSGCARSSCSPSTGSWTTGRRARGLSGDTPEARRPARPRSEPRAPCSSSGRSSSRSRRSSPRTATHRPRPSAGRRYGAFGRTVSVRGPRPERPAGGAGAWRRRRACGRRAPEGWVTARADEELMGVFGVPESHEDDALRAVRAATELRQAIAAEDELSSVSGSTPARRSPVTASSAATSRE